MIQTRNDYYVSFKCVLCWLHVSSSRWTSKFPSGMLFVAKDLKSNHLRDLISNLWGEGEVSYSFPHCLKKHWLNISTCKQSKGPIQINCPLLLTLGEHVFREMFNRIALFALSKGFAVSALKGETFEPSVVQLGVWITSKMLVVLKHYLSAMGRLDESDLYCLCCISLWSK